MESRTKRTHLTLEVLGAAVTLERYHSTSFYQALQGHPEGPFSSDHQHSFPFQRTICRNSSMKHWGITSHSCSKCLIFPGLVNIALIVKSIKMRTMDGNDLLHSTHQMKFCIFNFSSCNIYLISTNCLFISL